MAKRSKTTKKPGFLGRAFRSLFSIVILSAFVIGIALFVKELSSMDSDRLFRYASPLLERLGLDTNTAGDVAGDFIYRVSQTKINSPGQQVPSNVNLNQVPGVMADQNREVLFSMGLIADTGDENNMLQKAITQAQNAGVDHIVHLGDLTAWGDINSLTAVRDVFTTSKVMWNVIPGDHDLAESVGRKNFVQVFGEPNEVLDIMGKKVLLLDNAANFTPIDDTSLDWFLTELADADIVIMSQPLYHPANQRLMGIFDGVENKPVRTQAEMLLKEIRNSGVKAIIAADHHKSSKSVDPENSNLIHYVVGAAAVDRNLQRPRFSILKVYTNGDISVDDVVIE